MDSSKASINYEEHTCTNSLSITIGNEYPYTLPNQLQHLCTSW